MEQLIFINKLNIGSELMFPLLVYIVLFLSLYIIYKINKNLNKAMQKKPYIIIVTIIIIKISFDVYYIFYTNKKISNALNNTNTCEIIQGKIENYRYINDKNFADFKVNNQRFHRVEMSREVLSEKLNTKVKIEYITIFNEPVVIRIWRVN